MCVQTRTFQCTNSSGTCTILNGVSKWMDTHEFMVSLDDRGFESRQGLGTYLVTTVPRPALRPTQPPIQWVPGALSLGVKRPGREVDHSHPSSA
jgi:hypothetical protein